MSTTEDVSDLEQTTCPICMVDKPDKEVYCPACGYDYQTKQRSLGPFNFAYPTMEQAYKPSGKTSPVAITALVGASIVAGVLCGPLIYYTQLHGGEILENILKTMIRGSGSAILALMAATILYGFYMAVPFFFIGTGMMLFQNPITKQFKNRNIKVSVISGLLGGLVALAFYLGMGNNLFFVPEKEMVWLGIWTLCMMPLAGMGVGWIATESHFCEDCEEYMETHIIHTLPILLESALMDAIENGDWEKVKTLDKFEADDKDTPSPSANHSEVKLHYCKHCNENGYLDITTSQMRIEPAKKDTESDSTKNQSRMIYSGHLKPDALKILLPAVLETEPEAAVQTEVVQQS